MRKCCSVDGCTKKHNAKGYCDMHYKRLKRNGDPLTLKGKHDHCTIPGCQNPHESKGYCDTHYRRYFLQHVQKKKCQELDCDKPLLAKGKCETHYRQAYRAAGGC